MGMSEVPVSRSIGPSGQFLDATVALAMNVVNDCLQSMRGNNLIG